MAQQNDFRQAYDSYDAQTDGWQPFVGLSYAYDDNLFRIPNSLTFGQPTSDTSWTRDAGTRYDQTFGKQHVMLNIDVSKTTFDRFSAVDYDGKNFDANWAWAAGHDFTGRLESSFVQSLTPYTQFHSEELNLRTQKRNTFETYWHLTPQWQLHETLTDYALSYNLASQNYNNLNERIADFGLDYVSAAGNTIGVFLRRDRGDYPNEQIISFEAINNNYTQNEIDGQVIWSDGGKTHVQFTGGWLRRDYDYFPVRDISGPKARVTLDWVPTGITSLNATAWRDINAVDNLTTSYSVNKGISLTPTVIVFPKVRLDLGLQHVQMDYTESSVYTALLPQNRVDTLHHTSLALTYTPTRTVQLSAIVYAEKLSSTAPDVAYNAKGLMTTMKWSF